MENKKIKKYLRIVAELKLKNMSAIEFALMVKNLERLGL